MRRPLLAVLLALPLACASRRGRPAGPPDAPRPSTAAPGDEIAITILATTDLHGHVEGEREEVAIGGGRTLPVERGGLPLVAGYVANARAANPNRVLLLDAGDMMQGTLVSNLGEGRAVVKAMNAMGYAAAAIGNHEFDFGPVGPAVVPRAPGDDPRGALAARAAEARFPWLTANIVDDRVGPDAAAGRGGPPVPAARAFVLVEIDGVKIGIVGGTSEDTPSSTARGNLVGLRVEPLAPAIRRGAEALRAAGATVVIALVHEGGECGDNGRAEDLGSCRDDAPVFALARALPPRLVDAIFAGHTHRAIAHFVVGIPVLQAWANARALSRLDLLVDRRSGRPVPGGARIHPPEIVCGQITRGTGRCQDPRLRPDEVRPAMYEGRPVVADAAVAAAFADDIAAAAARRAEPIGVTLGATVHRAYAVESPLGNLAADALRRAAGADVGLMNGGGLRADLPSGRLTYGALFESFPFDNRLAVVRWTGATLRRLLERNVGGDRGMLSVSGLAVRGRCEGAALVLDLALADGRPLLDGERYTVATIDFLAGGGAGFADIVPAPGPPRAAIEAPSDEAAPLLREIVAGELRRRGPRIDGDRALFDPARPRVLLPAPRPVRCGAAAPR